MHYEMFLLYGAESEIAKKRQKQKLFLIDLQQI